MTLKSFRLFALLFLLLLLPRPALAQGGGDLTYTVQVGDTLSEIALKYGVGLAELVAYNGIANPDLILAGQQLTIPTPADASPAAETTPQTYTVRPGDTLFAIATRFGVRMSRLAEVNHIANVNWISVGQVLVIPADRPADAPLPAPFQTITLSEDPIAQGRTLVVFVTLATPAELDADWEGRPVFLSGDGQRYWGIVGVHALSEVGFHELRFRLTLPDGSAAEAMRMVQVVEGPYGTETIQVDASRQGLLEPSVVQAEAERVRAVWNQVTPRKWWDGPFRYPVAPDRITSPFGTRRSYGGGPVNGFHGGTDFGGGAGTPIYAPAPGVVVLAERLDVRGNAVIIDHGMGLFSGYWHQSQLAVQVGDVVAPGDLIGYIGDTGLVTGPHLHWEMRLGGIAVDPLQWVMESIP